MGSQVPERAGVIPDVRIICIRHPLRRRRIPADGRDDDELFRPARGDRAQHERIREREHRRDRAHGQGQREQRGEREPGAAPQRAKAVSQVLDRGFDEGQERSPVRLQS